MTSVNDLLLKSEAHFTASTGASDLSRMEAEAQLSIAASLLAIAKLLNPPASQQNVKFDGKIKDQRSHL